MAVRRSTQICERFQGAVDLLGKRWTGLIVQVLQDGPHRFGELAARIEVVSDRMLSERLKELEQNGVVERRVIADTPVKVEYRLTEKGRALARVIANLARWAEEWVTPQT